MSTSNPQSAPSDGIKDEPLVIWGRCTSLFVRKVIWTAEEVGRSYRRIDAGRAFGVVNTPGYRRLNPNGRVPTIEDGGFTLWESNAIVRYLCLRYGHDPLYPDDTFARMDAERWMDWASIEVFPTFRPALNVLARGVVEYAPRETAEECFARTNTLLGILDEVLEQRPYVGGKAFSMADIPIGAVVHAWMELGRNVPGLTHVKRWYHERIRSRPAAAHLLAPGET